MPKVVHSQPTASGLGLRDRKLRVYILRFIKLRDLALGLQKPGT